MLSDRVVYLAAQLWVGLYPSDAYLLGLGGSLTPNPTSWEIILYLVLYTLCDIPACSHVDRLAHL